MFRCIDCPSAWCGACKPPTLTILGKSTVPGLKVRLRKGKRKKKLMFSFVVQTNMAIYCRCDKCEATFKVRES